eukprot:m.434003 g.434003  ORF g.434003 m.434003 type:complete len:51 (-) comp95809_c0_seq1:115-267(-)
MMPVVLELQCISACDRCRISGKARQVDGLAVAMVTTRAANAKRQSGWHVP